MYCRTLQLQWFEIEQMLPGAVNRQTLVICFYKGNEDVDGHGHSGGIQISLVTHIISVCSILCSIGWTENEMLTTLKGITDHCSSTSGDIMRCRQSVFILL